jgi:hypothetical protein
MRIDILPNTAASILEMGNPKPEGDPGRENNSFFAVIDQMTSFAGPWKRDAEAEPARDVDKADDHGCDQTVSPILPFGFVNAEIQTSLGVAPEPMAALPRTDSAPARQVGNDAAGVLASAIVTDVDASVIAGSSALPAASSPADPGVRNPRTPVQAETIMPADADSDSELSPR